MSRPKHHRRDGGGHRLTGRRKAEKNRDQMGKLQGTIRKEGKSNMNTYGSFSTRETPQSEKIPGSSQVPNSAGGFAWEIDDWAKLDRFLILGTEGGTYYVKEKELTRNSAEAVIRCVQADGPRTVQRIQEISDSGRAAKNDPALFALALCFAMGDVQTKILANAALPRIARIGTHLFHFAQYVQQFRGWGPSLRRAVGGWYTNQTPERLGEQLVKYQQRDGWSHKDLITLSHPKAPSVKDAQAFAEYKATAILFEYAMGPEAGGSRRAKRIRLGDHPLPPIVEAFEQAKHLEDTAEGRRTVVRLIQDQRLTREMIPTHFLNYPEVWEALLITMPMEAMIRNLGNMSKVGLLKPLSEASGIIVERLGDQQRIQRARLHPIKILVALRTYHSGKGMRGSGQWEVIPRVVDALDTAFYTAFKNVEPTGKNLLLALDVSGSMSGGEVAGAPLTPCEASAALALVTASVEPNYHIMGFAHEFRPLGITAGMTLGEAIRRARDNNFGGTDCALPMQWALNNKVEVDGFIVYTDSETWAGRGHPSQALVQYRQQMNRPRSKSVVVGMVGNDFTIADPNDPGMLDVVGFDTATPEMISEFIR